MKTNVGTLDRGLRVVIATIFAFLIFLGYITAGWAIGFGIVAAILALTALVGYCPLYAVFGISTTERTAHRR